MKKRIISLLLAVMMVLTFVPTAFASGTGVKLNISSSADTSALKAGDVVTVAITLPEIDNYANMRIDLKYDNEKFTYNGDATSGRSGAYFSTPDATTVRVLDMEDTNTLTLETGTVALKASFTVNSDVSGTAVFEIGEIRELAQYPEGEYFPEDVETTWPSAETVIIAKEPVQVSIPEADTRTFTYSGLEQTYNIVSTDDYTVTGNKQTNAGDYDVIVSLSDKENTVWSDGTTTDKIYSFVINKAPVVIDVSIDGWVFGEAANDPSVSGFVGDGTITYEYKAEGEDDSAYTTIVPTAKGDYVVKATVAETQNYLSGSDTAEFSIAAKSLAAAIISDIDPYTYDGFPKTPTPAVTLNGTTLTAGVDFEYSYSGNTDAGVNAATVTITGKGNYAGSARKSFTINPAAQTISGSDLTIRVGKSADLNELFSASANGDLVFTIDGEDPTGSSVDGATLIAGTTPGSFTLKVTASAVEPNYTGAVQTFEVTVTAKLTQSDFGFYDGETRVASLTKTYGDDAFTLAATGAATDGTVTYTSSNESVATVDSNGTVTILNAGVTTITANATGDDDYEAASANYVLTVAKKEIPVPAADGRTFTYNGSEQTYGIESTDFYTVSGNKQTNAGTYSVTVVLVDKNNTVWEDSNDAADKTYGFCIAKAALTVTADSYQIEVGDSAPNPTYSVAGLKGSDTLESIGLVVTVDYESAPDTSRAGTYTIVVSGAADVANYTVAYVGGTLTIVKDSSDDPIIPPITTRYTLSFETNGGSAIASVTRVAGSTVNLSGYVPTKAGYDFAGWYADKALTEKVTSVKLTKNMTVYAKWTEIPVVDEPCDGGKDCPTYSFTDVDQTQWYHEGVDFVVETGMMIGTGDNKFDPHGVTSRAMIVTILYRLEGEPAVTGANPFSDVKNGTWYTDAVIWAEANGIVDGYGNGRFGPEDNITREQLAKIMYSYAKHKGYNVSARTSLASFSDADNVSSWAVEEMKWAVAVGLVNGMGDGTLAPQGNAERCQVAAIFMRFCNQYVK